MMNRARDTELRVVAAFQSWDDGETGASIVEYVLIVSFIAMIAFAAVFLLGQALDGQYSEIADSVN